MSTTQFPPLLVTPLESLSRSDRETFNTEVLDISNAREGSVISIPFPVAMYHRIDGVWIPVSDLGAFHSPALTVETPETNHDGSGDEPGEDGGD